MLRRRYEDIEFSKSLIIKMLKKNNLYIENVDFISNLQSLELQGIEMRRIDSHEPHLFVYELVGKSVYDRIEGYFIIN